MSAGIKEGKSVDELQKTIKLDKCRSWMGYEMQLPAVIESAYTSLTKYRGT